MRRLVIAACIVSVGLMSGLSGCGYDRFAEPYGAGQTQGSGNRLVANITLANFVARGGVGQPGGQPGGQPVRVEDSLVFFGRVASSDRERNFFRTLVIEDGGVGIEILTGLYDTWSLYPPGMLIYVCAKGLVFDGGGGMPVLGCDAQPGSRPQAGYFASRALVGEHIRTTDDIKPVQPTPRTIGELTPGMCGTLAIIGGLHYTGSTGGPGSVGDVWAGKGDAWREFGDAPGGRVMVFVAAGATFAAQRIPAGELSVCGVIQREGSLYTLVPRGAADIVPWAP